MQRQTTILDAPLLGVAGNAGQVEFQLAARFDELHQLLYTKGGIRPTNAAIEEITKLVLLRLWAARDSDARCEGVPVADLFSGAVSSESLVDLTKKSFQRVLTLSDFSTRDAENGLRTLWPLDEPFRLANPEVLQQALFLVDAIIKHDTRIADPLGTAFDAFLSGRYDHSGGLGTFLTPSSIARAMADIALSLVDPLLEWDGHSPLIADPFCGTGRFLVSAFDAMEASSTNHERLQDLLDYGLLGADQSTTAVAKAGLNLLLYGASMPHVYAVEDSMTDAHLDKLAGKLKLVLTNPPFGGAKYTDPAGIARTAKWMPGLARNAQIDPALAGLARSLDLLSPGGVLGIVLPDGIIEGRHFSQLLESAIQGQRVSVAASVSLPSASFSLSGTMAKTSAVFIKKEGALQSKRTVLARVDHVGFVKQAGKAAVDPAGNEVPRLASSVIEAFSLDLGEDEPVVQASSWPLVLSVLRTGLTSLDPSRLDPEALKSRIRIERMGSVRLGTLISSTRVRRAKTRTNEPFVSVLHVDELGTVKWNEAQTYHPATPGQLAKTNQVLISLLNPSKLRAGVVPMEIEEVHCSTEFGVFSTENDPYAILGLLYHPDVQAQLRPLGRGTSSSRRRISPEDVLALAVPSLKEEELQELGRRVQCLVRGIETARTDLEQIYVSPLDVPAVAS